jgi:hypothetical protein
MAGTIIVSSIKTDTDNSFIVRSNTGATLFSVDTTSISIPDGSITSAMIANGTVIAADILDGTITDAKISAVANTKITGLITSGQIATVANTQITGLITSGQIATVANTQITGNIISSQITSVQASSLPAGSVIGFGQTYLTTQKTTTSSTYVTTGLEITYTKKVSSSYVLVLATPTLQAYRTSAGNAQLSARIYDSTNSVEIYDFKQIWRSYDSGNANLISGPCTLQAIDTNSGTGSRTYRVDFKVIDASDIRINLDNNGDTASSITVWEIAQ